MKKYFEHSKDRTNKDLVPIWYRYVLDYMNNNLMEYSYFTARKEPALQ